MEPGTNTSQQNTIYKTIGMALELAKEGHSEGVLNLLLSILPPPFGTNTAITPSDSELEFDSIVEKHYWMKYHNADFTEPAIRLNAAYQLLAFTYFQIKEFDKALEVADAGLKRAPLKVDLLLEKLEILKVKGKFAEVKSEALKWLNMTWRSIFIAKLYRTMAFADVEMENWDVAAACLLRSLEFHNVRMATQELMYIIEKAGWTAEAIRGKFTPESITDLLTSNGIPLGPSLQWAEVAEALRAENASGKDLYAERFCCRVLFEVTGDKAYINRMQALTALIEKLKLKPKEIYDYLVDVNFFKVEVRG